MAGNFRGADNGCGGRVGNVVRRFPGWKKLQKTEAEKMIFMFLGREVRIKEKEESRISYPARYMRKSELLKMQNPLLGETVLERAEKYAPAGVVRKINPMKRNSPLVFDTVELEKWRAKH